MNHKHKASNNKSVFNKKIKYQLFVHIEQPLCVILTYLISKKNLKYVTKLGWQFIGEYDTKKQAKSAWILLGRQNDYICYPKLSK